MRACLPARQAEGDKGRREEAGRVLVKVGVHEEVLRAVALRRVVGVVVAEDPEVEGLPACSRQAGGLGGGYGDNAGERPFNVNRLILEAIRDPQRRWNRKELRAVIDHVARAGFNPGHRRRVREILVINDIRWRGRRLHQGDEIPTAVEHYLIHAIVNKEWPEGTTFEHYLDSIRRVVRDKRAGLLVGLYQGEPQLTIVRRSGELRGPEGNDYIIVEYRVSLGHWVTAFQPMGTLEEIEMDLARTESRWIRRPI